MEFTATNSVMVLYMNAKMPYRNIARTHVKSHSEKNNIPNENKCRKIIVTKYFKKS